MYNKFPWQIASPCLRNCVSKVCVSNCVCPGRLMDCISLYKIRTFYSLHFLKQPCFRRLELAYCILHVKSITNLSANTSDDIARGPWSPHLTQDWLVVLPHRSVLPYTKKGWWIDLSRLQLPLTKHHQIPHLQFKCCDKYHKYWLQPVARMITLERN